jgi:hypothetical protein
MSRSWTYVYVSFSLPIEDLTRLNEHLRQRGSSVGREFHRALLAAMAEAGIPADHLNRPDDEVDPDDHH